MEGKLEHPFCYEKKGATTMVIMIHGILESPRQFLRFAQAMKEVGCSYDVISLPGHGGTGEEFAKSNRAQWEREVQRKVKCYKTRYSDIVLIGHSMGGLLAMQAYEWNTDVVKSLILIATPLRVRVKPHMVLDGWKVIMHHVEQDDLGAFYAREAIGVGRGSVGLYYKWIPRYLELFVMVRQARKRVSNIKVPVLVIQSKRDEFVSKGSVYLFEKKLPRIERILWLKHSRHFRYDGEELSGILKECKRFVRHTVIQ